VRNHAGEIMVCSAKKLDHVSVLKATETYPVFMADDALVCKCFPYAMDHVKDISGASATQKVQAYQTLKCHKCDNIMQ